jgi:hypothetical protein
MRLADGHIYDESTMLLDKIIQHIGLSDISTFGSLSTLIIDEYIRYKALENISDLSDPLPL